MQTLYLTAGENAFRAWQFERERRIIGIALTLGYTGAAGSIIAGCYIRQGVRSSGPSDLATDVLAALTVSTTFSTAAAMSKSSDNIYIPMDVRLMAGESITLCVPNIVGDPTGTVRGEALIFFND